MSTNIDMLCDYKRIEVIDHVSTGAKMRRFRLRYGISLRALAKVLKVSAPYLSDLERGRRCWTPKRVIDFNQAMTWALIKRIQKAAKNAHKSNLKLD